MPPEWNTGTQNIMEGYTPLEWDTGTQNHYMEGYMPPEWNIGTQNIMEGCTPPEWNTGTQNHYGREKGTQNQYRGMCAP